MSRKRLLPALPAGMPLPPGISAEELAALMQDAPEHEAALNAQGFRIPRENAQSRRRERRSLAREG